MLLGATCSLDLSEWLLTKHTYPEETEEGKVSASNEASSSHVSTESERIESCPKSEFLVQKEVILTAWFKWKVGNSWHLVSESRVNVYSSNEELHQPGASKFVNLKLNYHTRITRFIANHKLRVDNVKR